MEFDGRVDKLRDIVKPLTVKTSLVQRKDVYYLRFDIDNPLILQPGWESLSDLIRPLMKANFPHSRISSSTPHRVNYRLGSLFDFLAQKPNDSST